MSVNNQNSELKDDFIIKHIKMISELYDAETFLHEKIINNKIQMLIECFLCLIKIG